MKLDATLALKSQGFPVSFTCQTAMADLTVGSEKVTFTAPLALQGEVLFTGDEFWVSGTLRTAYEAVCGRCLDPFVTELELPFREEFARVADEEKPERYLFEGDTIDLAEMVNDLVVLSIPMRHVCREDCRGLCPVCGTNLNKNSCSCSADEEDSADLRNPFSALKALLHDENEEV